MDGGALRSAGTAKEILDEFIKNVDELCKILRDLPQEAWSRESRHETMGGELALQLWVERSLAHIEEHLRSREKGIKPVKFAHFLLI